MRKHDATPPGREEQVRALKTAKGVDNPYAVAWASYNKGHGDGTPYESAGAKASPEGSPYEAATERDAPFGHNQETGDDDMYDDDDDVVMKHPEDISAATHAVDLHQHEGHPVHASQPSQPEHEFMRKDPDDDDDEHLLDEDDSEVASGEHLPELVQPNVNPPVGGPVIGVHQTIADPVPENFGRDPVNVEGETANDDDDDAKHLDDDDDAAHFDDDAMGIFGRK